jgi:hypothetical protein
MNAEQKRNVVFAFTNVLRTSTLAGQVDIQRTVAGFAAYLDQLPPDQPIPLQPLYDGMLQAQLPQPAVDAALAFFASREQRLGVQFVLPAQLATLPPAQREALVAAFAKNGATTGTFAGRSISASGQSGVHTGTHGAFVPGQSGVHTQPPMSQAGGVTGNHTPTPASTSGGMQTPDFSKNRKKKESGPSRAMIATLLVLLVAAGGFWGYTLATRQTRQDVHLVMDSAGLPCTSTTATGTILVCTIPTGVWEREGPEAMKTRARITKLASVTRGFSQLYVISEDGKVRGRF